MKNTKFQYLRKYFFPLHSFIIMLLLPLSGHCLFLFFFSFFGNLPNFSNFLVSILAPPTPYLVNSSSHGDGSPSLQASTTTLWLLHCFPKPICLPTLISTPFCLPQLPSKLIQLPFGWFAPHKLPSRQLAFSLANSLSTNSSLIVSSSDQPLKCWFDFLTIANHLPHQNHIENSRSYCIRFHFVRIPTIITQKQWTNTTSKETKYFVKKWIYNG